MASLNAVEKEQKHKMNKKVGEQQVKVDCMISKISNRIQGIQKEKQAKESETSECHGSACRGMPNQNFATARRIQHDKKEYEAISRIIKTKGKGT